MKMVIRDREVFENLNTDEIASYLRSTGWREVVSKPNHSSIWRKKFEGEDFEILLPLNRAFGDFTLRMADVVGDLAAVERRSQLEILADLHAVFPSDWIPVFEAAARLLEGIKKVKRPNARKPRMGKAVRPSRDR
ncbi:MAG TPA: hypothetical protein VH682_00180 [Gemmataceae bacterium]|jgi:hypothetical protein